MPSEDKGGFFGDPQKYLIKVLIALVPMVTLVPLVVNKIDKIARTGMLASYRIFVIVYFILPVLLIGAWVISILLRPYRIRPDVIPGSPDNKPPIYQTLLPNYNRPGNRRTYRFLLSIWGIFLLIAALYFLFIDCPFFTCLFLGWSFLLLIVMGMLVYLIARRIPAYKHDIGCGANDDRDKLLAKFSSSYTQWCILIILCIAAIAWGAWRLESGKLQNGTDSSGPKTAFYLLDHNDTIRLLPDLIDSFQKSLHPLALDLEIADRGKTADSMSLSSLKELMPALDQKIEVLNQFYSHKCDSASAADSHCPCVDSLKPYIFRRHFSDITSRMDLLNKYSGDTTWAFLTAYLNRLKELSFNAAWYASGWDEHTREKWSDILQDIQFKSFILFFMTLLALFTAWFFSLSEDLRRQALTKTSSTSLVPVGRSGRQHFEVHEKESYQSFPILFALSRSTTILILLIIPFFKAITPASINLDQPFLSEPATKLFSDWQADQSSTHSSPSSPVNPPFVHVQPDTVYFKDTTLKRAYIVTQKIDLKNDQTLIDLINELKKYKPGQTDSNISIIKGMLQKLSRR